MSKQKQDSNFIQRLAMVACTVIVFLTILGGLCYGAWRLVVKVEPGILAAWALLTTAAVPLAGLAGYKLGGTEARGLMQGIGLGTGPVVETAQKVADVRVSTVQRLRQVEPVQTVEVQLPVFNSAVPRRLSSGNGNIIDL